jgi:hypothetical protein
LVERTAHNGFVAGSSPATPIAPIVDLTTRDYQIARIKQFLIENKLCFFFQNSTEKAFDWLITEQIVDNEDLQYFKMNTLSAKRALNKSKHKLKDLLITTTTSLLKQKAKFLRFSKLTFNKIMTVFVFIAIKTNSSIYSSEQFKSLWVFYYQVTQLNVYNFILSNIKTKKLLKLTSK